MVDSKSKGTQSQSKFCRIGAKTMNDKDAIKCPNCGEWIDIEYQVELIGNKRKNRKEKAKRKQPKENITNKMAQLERIC